MDEYMGGNEDLLFSDEFRTDENGEPIVDAEFYHPGLPSSEPPAEEPEQVETVVLATPRERLEKLLDGAMAYKKEFFEVIDFCRQPQPVDAVKALIADRQQYGLSAYNPTNLLMLLEHAGALVKLDESGEPYDPEAVKPKQVVVDGVAYYEVSKEPPQIFWSATEDAIALVDEDDPVQRTNEMFAARPEYLFIYEGILRMCATPEGGKAQAFEDWLRERPDFMDIPFKASSFTTKLDEVGAIEWRGSWLITDYGRSLLEKFDQDAVDAGTVAALEM